jgi:hypothetical protein
VYPGSLPLRNDVLPDLFGCQLFSSSDFQAHILQNLLEERQLLPGKEYPTGKWLFS